MEFVPRKLTGHNGSVYSLALGDDGNFFTGAGDGWIAEWPFKNGEDGRLVAEASDQVFSLLKLQDAPWMVAGTMQGQLYFINLDFPDQIRNMSFHEQGIFAFAQIENRVVAAGGDGKLSIWNWKEQQLVESISLSNNRLRGLALSPNGQLLAVGSSDTNIYVLHVGSWKILEVINAAHSNSIFDLVFSNDGNYLLSGGRDAHLKVWSVNEGFSLAQDLAAHWYTINALAMHPSGRWLATASRDKTIRIWDMRSYELKKTLDLQRSKGHLNSVNAVHWSANGKYLISGSDDRSVIIWTFQPGD